MKRLKALSACVSFAAAAALLAASGCKSGRDDTGADAMTRPEPEVVMGEDPTAQRPLPPEQNMNTFLNELRDSTAAQDMHRLAALMTPNFGYQLDPPLEGDGVFQYWDENNLWGELALIVSEEFVSNGDFMVAPPEFADPATLYTGYRAGITKVDGKWKFAYFVRN